MTQRHRDRLMTLKKAAKGLISQSQAVEEIGQSEQHIRRSGETQAGRPDAAPPTARPPVEPQEKRQDAGQSDCRARAEDLHGFGPTLASEYLDKHHQIQVSRETVRGWMMKTRLWRPKKAKVKKIRMWMS